MRQLFKVHEMGAGLKCLPLLLLVLLLETESLTEPEASHLVIPVSTLHSWVTSTQELHPTFYVGARDLNLGVDPCAASVLTPLLYLPLIVCLCARVHARMWVVVLSLSGKQTPSCLVLWKSSHCFHH